MKLNSRVHNLRALNDSLNLLESEICGNFTPMPDVLDKLSNTLEFPVCLMYKNVKSNMDDLGNVPFSAVWRKGVKDTAELLLEPTEAAAIAEMGFSLGRYYPDEQRKAINHARKKLECFIEEAELKRRQDSKVRAAFSIAVGIFTVIILI